MTKYNLPEIDRVFPTPEKQVTPTRDYYIEQAQKIQKQLANFQVHGKVTRVCPGVVITRYEVKLNDGVKISKVSKLADDLALTLKAKSIRILAPIPGKDVIGIEIPNDKAHTVYIKTVLKSPLFKSNQNLPIALGKTVDGKSKVIDLTEAPHLLIAGRTGAGKSVAINSFISSILCSKNPEEVKLILIDPKMVELISYKNIPHLLTPVITQPDQAIEALKWATKEMDERYSTLAEANTRNIKDYNFKVKEQVIDKMTMPYIVIVIDEFSDLMMTSGKELESHIVRITQKARAVGIHLILTTQRPSVDVVTGMIKSNLPTRIGFQTSSQTDSKTIMDKIGCEKLLGNGDMLYKSVQEPHPERIHGSFIADNEIDNIVNIWRNQKIKFDFSTISNEPEIVNYDEKDPRYEEALKLVTSYQHFSLSFIQRKMEIDYSRAKRIFSQLEYAGVKDDIK